MHFIEEEIKMPNIHIELPSVSIAVKYNLIKKLQFPILEIYKDWQCPMLFKEVERKFTDWWKHVLGTFTELEVLDHLTLRSSIFNQLTSNSFANIKQDHVPSMSWKII